MMLTREILCNAAAAAIVCAGLTFGSTAAARDARTLAGRIATGDTRLDVIAKIGKPASAETGRYLGVEVEVLNFRIGISEVVVVRLVLGRVVGVETKQVLPWESR